jgi:hypothetical protein
MIRPNYNKLQVGDAVEVAAEDVEGWLSGIVTDVRRNHQGEVVWTDVTPDDGSGQVRVEAGYIEGIRRRASA